MPAKPIKTARRAYLARREARRHLIAKYRHEAELIRAQIEVEAKGGLAGLAAAALQWHLRHAKYHQNMLLIEQQEWDAGYAPPVNRHWKAVTSG